MNSKLKLEEAIARYTIIRGAKITKKDLARALYPKLPDNIRQVKLSHILSGKTKRFSPELICAICRLLDTTPNMLLGYNREVGTGEATKSQE